MRRVLGWIAALVMILGSCAAFGEANGTPDLYDLYEDTENGKIWIGTAVPILDGVVLCSPAGLPETMTAPVIWDGSDYRPVSVALLTGEGTVLVVLHDVGAEAPAIPSYPFLEAGRIPQADELTVRSGDRLKSRINRAVLDLSSVSWLNRDALLLTLSGDTVPGAPLITADGKLAGIVITQYAEGLNRYVALPVPEISRCLNEASMLLEEPEEDTRPEGYTVTMDRNMVTFDWSEVAERPAAGEGETLFFILADAESGYLTYVALSGEDTQITMLLTPGRMYFSGLGVSAGVPDELPEQLAVTAVPEAEPLTEHQFRSKVFAIAEMPRDGEGMPTVPEQVTEALLRSGNACLYSVSTYRVDEELNDCTLLVSLTDPEGNNYRYESGWYYDPSLMDEDAWYVSMEETGLLDMLEEYGYPAGFYEMSMYIDGQLADSFTFELIP